MSSEHVAHLQRMANESWIGSPERAALDAAIASLSAPQPPAEAQPVAWQFQGRDGRWHGFIDERHRQNTIADGSWPIRALYAHSPPSAPVGVNVLNTAAVEAGHINFESMKQCADSWLAVVDALNTATPDWCENKGTGRECAVAAIAALAQQPAACVGCEGKPSPENTPCAVCGQQPAAVGGIERLTEQQAVIVTGYTGVLCCEFSAFHTDLERRAGRPVFTHEMADFDWIKPMYLHDFIALAAQQGGET